VNGIISVNKARVAGVERCQTKTGEDRRVALCPRASAVHKRQLALRNRLRAAGLVQHDHVFFRETGEPFWNLQIQGERWRKTLTSLKLRYRRPYTARHSSVSRNLMAGRNPLWVAKQLGHSICTMLRVYAAWADGAVESEVEAIKRSMNPRARLSSTTKSSFSAAHRLPCSRPTHPLVECLNRMRQLPANANLAVDRPVQTGAKTQVLDNWWERMAEREGFEPSKGF
jgi:hypothetical protein